MLSIKNGDRGCLSYQVVCSNTPLMQNRGVNMARRGVKTSGRKRMSSEITL